MIQRSPCHFSWIQYTAQLESTNGTIATTKGSDIYAKICKLQIRGAACKNKEKLWNQKGQLRNGCNGMSMAKNLIMSIRVKGAAPFLKPRYVFGIV